MGRVWWALFALAGCNSILGIGDPEPAPPDAPSVSCLVEGTDLCAYQLPYGPIRFTADTRIDTNDDCNVVLLAPGGGSVCVVYGSSIDVTAHVRATGSRPLVLAATGPITVSGNVDVSSGRTTGAGAASNNNPACAVDTSNQGYGGGAGGSFHGVGGNGGVGMGSASNTPITAQAAFSTPPKTLLGGCHCVGESLFEGNCPAGGAVQLASGTSIEIGATGVVSANGAGGQLAGGGSGGMIELSAPVIAIHGVLAANGGGGGQGVGGQFGQEAAGADGANSATPALGGFGGAFASGGAGAAGAMLAGTKGSDANMASYGGGFGGGGAGYIVIDTPPTDTSGAVISPSPTQN